MLTQLWFPRHYFDYAFHFQLAGVVLARDLVLVVLLGVLAWPALATDGALVENAALPTP